MKDKRIYTNSSKFKWALVIFSFMGQVAWVVENMYFNVFIYKMFNASATDISFMVSCSAITAAVTTLVIGTLSDRIKKRKLLISLGYIFWGLSIASFVFFKVDILQKFTGSVASAMSLGISLTIFMDCVMTFFGSSANDAAFNAWLTDCGTQENRGKIEGINSMMPLIAILAVFGGFMALNLDKSQSWTAIFLIIGGFVVFIGILGFFLIEDHITQNKDSLIHKTSFLENLIYSFKPNVIKQNILLYILCGAFAVFCISIQVFMPYLILYYEKTLNMTDYVLIMAPAVILAAIVTAFYGKVYDKLGFKTSVIPALLVLMAGYIFLYFSTAKIPVFIGSLFMMTGYLTGMAVFGAVIRQHIPEDKAGLFQGLRIIAQVLIPGVIGPFIGALVLQNAQVVTNADGTTSFLPNKYIFLAAFIVALVLFTFLFCVFKIMKNMHHPLESQENPHFLEENSCLPFDTYPRPQLKRDSFVNLNGKWTLNKKSIIVPFPPESEASEYNGKLGKNFVYSKKFVLPKNFIKDSTDRIILHFGAVDQIAKVFIDDIFVGIHKGGYLPFSFDITDYLGETTEHSLKVLVKDTLSHTYPYGKQKKNRGGMWYTPVSGIWQTVWLEAVPEIYIHKIIIDTDMNGLDVFVETTNCQLPEKDDVYDFALKIKLRGESQKEYVFESDSTKIRIDLPIEEDFLLWSPDNPKLYDFTVELYASSESIKNNQLPLDCVDSYFGLREVTIKNIQGNNFICLNDKPIFLHGVLDQGYYPEGIYLPYTEDGFEKDIVSMQALGFNTLRKHIKIEPEIFYYLCDKHGMLIMQDMVNNGSYNFLRDTALPTVFSKKGLKKHNANVKAKNKKEQFFLQHCEETLEHLYNHPCVVYYTIFNEGWGQHKAQYYYDYLKALDSSRIFDTASGWFKGADSDVESDHIYFKTPSLEKRVAECTKPLIISECGGYTLEIPEHSWSLYGKYGYGGFSSSEELTKQVRMMYEKMILPCIKKGLCGCVYTQLSDVEDEINGFYTYDRKVCKVQKAAMKELAQRCYAELDEFTHIELL